MMTHRQAELYVFIRDFTREHGYAPSTDEMKDALGLVSKSNITRIIGGLEERGLLRRLHHRARAIEVIERDEPLKIWRGGQVDPLPKKKPGVTELYVRARTEKPPSLPYTGLKPRSW